MTIVCATNEQKNEHIKAYFDKRNIKYIDRALKTGDYCFMIPKNGALGFEKDTYFTDELMIERKNSLGELAGSINNETFHYELKRSQGIDNNFLLVEQQGGWHDILTHNYRNEYNEKSFYNTLCTLMAKYDIKICFVPQIEMGLMIWSICRSVLSQYVLYESV
jgi:ERCC4-type nuclease